MGLEAAPGVPLCSHLWSQSSSDRPESQWHLTHQMLLQGVVISVRF